MFKLFIAVILILSCGMMGLIKSHSYSKRIRQLNYIRDTLKILNSEISFRKDPLPVIFQRISGSQDNIVSLILLNCCRYMEQGLEIEECWNRAVDQAYIGSNLTPSDRAVICSLGSQIGKSNIKGQNETFMLADEKLQHQIISSKRIT